MPTLKFKNPVLHAEGSFAAEVTAIEEEVSQYGPAFKVYLTTDEGVVEALISQSYTPKSKLTQLIYAAFGDRPADVDTADLIQCKVGIVVETVEKDGSKYSKVTSFHRLKAKKKVDEDPFETE